MVFASFLAISVICTIVGLVVAYSNSDSTDIFDYDSSNPQPENRDDKYSEMQTTSINTQWDSHVMLGVALFGIGLFGTAAAGIGLFCSSLFLCYQKRMRTL